MTLKAGGGTITVNDDVIKGTLRVGSTVEVKQDPKKDAMEAVISKIQDCSQYTVGEWRISILDSYNSLLHMTQAIKQHLAFRRLHPATLSEQ